jgi:allophanate hydrolase
MIGFSLDVSRLSAAYAQGIATPAAVMGIVLDRIAAAGDDHVWIARRPDDAILAEAEALALRGPAGLPLYGLPFAVKDNIDAAGLDTTAACPEFAYRPTVNAPSVQRLIDAGAILIGKTNLDQFATGLVGVRSPYGIPRNSFDPAMVPGGSSSGSAVAVAAGLVSFALGTDTAGSGRVPAAFNNLVGLKPTRGLVSPRGMVPACRPYDCITVFALTVADAVAVLETIHGFDPEEAWSRPAPPGFALRQPRPAAFRFGIPDQRRFFGDAEAEALFDAAIARAESLGGIAEEIDFAPWAEAAALLYGPLVAERTAVVGDFIAAHPDAAHPVVAGIIAGGAKIPAPAVLRAQHRLTELAGLIRPVWDDIDVLLVPTTGTAFTVEQVLAEPILRNSELGTYTNFTNLLDLSALAVPNGFYSDGFPAGVTLIGPAWHDGTLAAIGAAMQQAAATPLGATGIAQPVPAAAAARDRGVRRPPRRPAAQQGPARPRRPAARPLPHRAHLPHEGAARPDRAARRDRHRRRRRVDRRRDLGAAQRRRRGLPRHHRQPARPRQSHAGHRRHRHRLHLREHPAHRPRPRHQPLRRLARLPRRQGVAHADPRPSHRPRPVRFR